MKIYYKIRNKIFFQPLEIYLNNNNNNNNKNYIKKLNYIFFYYIIILFYFYFYPIPKSLVFDIHHPSMDIIVLLMH